MCTLPLAAALGVALAALTACASSTRDDDRYAGAPVAQPAHAQPGYQRQGAYANYGVVRAIEIVPMTSRPNSAGGILGAVVGNPFRQRLRPRRRDDEVFRVSVRFDDGSVRDFDYQRVDDLRTGDRVKLAGGQLHYVP